MLKSSPLQNQWLPYSAHLQPHKLLELQQSLTWLLHHHLMAMQLPT